MYCATSLSSAPPFFSRKRRNETSPLSLLSSSKTSFLHFLTDRTAISTIMPSSGVPVKRPYNCVLPASMGSATPVEGSTRKNMCHLPWRFLHVSDVFEIHRRLKIAGRNHISRCHHLDGHRRTSVPAGGSPAHAASAEATRSRKSCDRPRSANRTKRHAGGGCLPHHEKGGCE